MLGAYQRPSTPLSILTLRNRLRLPKVRALSTFCSDTGVVELGGERAFVRGHGLCVFESAAALEIGGDAGCAEHMAAELTLQAGLGGAPPHHLIGVDAMGQEEVLSRSPLPARWLITR